MTRCAFPPRGAYGSGPVGFAHLASARCQHQDQLLDRPPAPRQRAGVDRDHARHGIWSDRRSSPAALGRCRRDDGKCRVCAMLASDRAPGGCGHEFGDRGGDRVEAGRQCAVQQRETALRRGCGRPCHSRGAEADPADSARLTAAPPGRSVARRGSSSGRRRPLTQSTAPGVGRALAAGQGREVLVRMCLPPLPGLIYTGPAGAS